MSQDKSPDKSDLIALRRAIRDHTLTPEGPLVAALIEVARLSLEERASISARAADYVRRVRAETEPTVMESFLSEYGLSTDEGVGLMCLAEALLRVPDAETIDALISDKIEPSNWGAHLGKSHSSLVNASTWALMLTGKVLDHDPTHPAAALRGLIRRVGEPVVRTAVAQSMRILGRQFVLGETIDEALSRAADLEREGYTHSYDMLGEAARTDADALRYMAAYKNAIEAIAGHATGDVRSSPGISVKLSALHPRYEYPQRATVLTVLAPRALELARLAAVANIGFNIDAEEADRLDLSLDVIEFILGDPALAGWDGFGVVVQAYGRRAGPVIDWLHALAERLDRRIMVRLVKGAYWDTEIKLAQELGIESFPVFTRKANTDVSYLSCARRLLEGRDRLYPQFATHNAHTMAAVQAMAGGDTDSFEFQRLHGMGEALHGIVKRDEGSRCRIYAPVGAHRDLLAYLVRRLLENGANSSFVHQIVDHDISPEEIARCPIGTALDHGDAAANPAIRQPPTLFGSNRVNAKGWNVNEPSSILPILAARERFRSHRWHAAPIVAGPSDPEGAQRPAFNPADHRDQVGTVTDATPADVTAALDAAVAGAHALAQVPVAERAAILRAVADLYEANAVEFFALATREAGKTLRDGIAEVREAVDFLRYYADEAERLDTEQPGAPRGVFVCISPWNFPLAIFTGQIAAALAAGNAVIAKPAEQTPLIAARAVELMREAGVVKAALQLLPGDGPSVGAPLTADPRIAGVCFTGSTEVARLIDRTMAKTAAPDAALIAETGGLNAMIVDSSALTEQAVRDILISAFQSAGQRCSALRILYVQEEARERLLGMLHGAMAALRIGDPWDLDTDVSPVIDAEAQGDILAYCAAMEAKGRLTHRPAVPSSGTFVPPCVVEVEGIAEMEREVFGPVLHVATYKARDLDAVVDAINARGYGLTFGLHTRIDDRVQQVVERLHVGNLYINRNQIGAIVGSQPFGGEGLSGTGPKAGGPNYVARFRRTVDNRETDAGEPKGRAVSGVEAQAEIDRLDATEWAARNDRLDQLRSALVGIDDPAVGEVLRACAARMPTPCDLPGPTGESNRLLLYPRGTALCLGPTAGLALAQATQALAAGCAALMIAPGATPPPAATALPVATIDGVLETDALTTLSGIGAVAAAGASPWAATIRRALANRDGPILPLVTETVAPRRYVIERHLCIDTTAAGGNASLLAST